MFCIICGKSTKFNKDLCPRCEFNSVIAESTPQKKETSNDTDVKIDKVDTNKSWEAVKPKEIVEPSKTVESRESVESKELVEPKEIVEPKETMNAIEPVKPMVSMESNEEMVVPTSFETQKPGYVKKVSNIMDEFSSKKTIDVEKPVDLSKAKPPIKKHTLGDNKETIKGVRNAAGDLGSPKGSSTARKINAAEPYRETTVRKYRSETKSEYRRVEPVEADEIDYTIEPEDMKDSIYDSNSIGRKSPTGETNAVSEKEIAKANAEKISRNNEKTGSEKKSASRASKSRPKGIKIIVAVLVLVLVFVTVLIATRGGQGVNIIAQDGFRNPEDAVIQYLEGLRDSDLNKMLSAFAIEVYVENQDFQALLNRIHAYYPTMEIRMPNANDFVMSINSEKRRSDIMNSIEGQFLNLAQVGFDVNSVHHIEDPEEFVDNFIGYLLSPNLRSLEVVGFIPPEKLSEVYLSPENQNNIEWQTYHLRIDERESKVAVFNLDDQRHILIVEVGSYNGRWFILQFGGNLSHLLAMSHFMHGIIPPEHIDGVLWWVDSVDDLIVR